MADELIRSLPSKSHIVVFCADCERVVLFTSFAKQDSSPKIPGDKLFLVTMCLGCEEYHNKGWGTGSRNTETSAFERETMEGWKQFEQMNSYLGGDLQLPKSLMPVDVIITVPQEKIKNCLESRFIAQSVDIDEFGKKPLVVCPYLHSGFL